MTDFTRLLRSGFSAILACCAMAPVALEAQTISCFYNEQGVYKGADSCRPGQNIAPCDNGIGAKCRVGFSGLCRAENNRRSNGDYTQFKVIDRSGGTSCENAIPALVDQPGGGQDRFTYEPGKLTAALDQELVNEIDDYVTFTKSITLGELQTDVTFTVEVSVSENYYSILMLTPGSEGLKGGGLGYRTGVFAYSDDWHLRYQTQAIYGTGIGMDSAVADLQAKFNGINGRIAFSASGDATRGEMVLTLEKQ